MSGDRTDGETSGLPGVIGEPSAAPPTVPISLGARAGYPVGARAAATGPIAVIGGATPPPVVPDDPTDEQDGGTGGLARRAGWNLVDQMLSSASNALLTILVARQVGPVGVGAFAVGFIVFTVTIGVSRAIAGQPLSIRWAAAEGPALRRALNRSMGAVLALTLMIGVACVLLGLVIGDLLGPVLVVFGVLLPGLILQDACRMAFFARSRADLATVNDGLWAVTQFGGMGVLIAVGHATTVTLVLAWGLSALLCTIVGLVQLRAVPQLSGALPWIKDHKDVVGYLTAEFLLGAGALQGGILIVGAFIGLGDLGAFRGAQTLTGPLAVVMSAALAFGLPEMSRRSHALSGKMKWTVAVGASTFLVAGSSVYAGLLLLIPDGLGNLLLHETWDAAHEVLLPFSLVSVGMAACVGPLMVILALGQAQTTFTLTAIEAVTVPIGLFAGAYLGGGEGAVWGLAVQQWCLVPLWFLQLARILIQEKNDPSQPEPDPA